MKTLRYLMILLAVLGPSLLSAEEIRACPFCAAIKNTLSEEIESVDAAVVGKLQSACKPGPDDKGGAKARFEVVDVLKGEKLLGSTKFIDTIYFGEAPAGKLFLIAGVGPTDLQWATPQALGDKGRDYLHQILKLPKSGKERLSFFLKYLEHADPLLAIDSYDEFARAPYADVVAIKDQLDRGQIMKWIKDPAIPASRSRLHITLLGICGTAEELPVLEEMIRSPDRKYKQGLDALLACYVNLKGAEGADLLDELFLKNNSGEYADTYAALMALRFHLTETKVLTRERILKSFHYMLDRPQLADLVIPDLARMEDWTVIDRLLKLFKDATEKNNWVRVPVINYMRVCPLPEAKKALVELETIDPQAVKRANTFFPLGPAGGGKPETVTPKSSQLKLDRYQEQNLVASMDVPLPPPDTEEDQSAGRSPEKAGHGSDSAVFQAGNGGGTSARLERKMAPVGQNSWPTASVVSWMAALAAVFAWAARPQGDSAVK